MDRSSFNPKFMLYFHHLCPYPLAQGAISIALCDQTDFYQHLSDAKLIYVMDTFYSAVNVSVYCLPIYLTLQSQRLTL